MNKIFLHVDISNKNKYVFNCIKFVLNGYTCNFIILYQNMCMWYSNTYICLCQKAYKRTLELNWSLKIALFVMSSECEWVMHGDIFDVIYDYMHLFFFDEFYLSMLYSGNSIEYNFV